MLSVQELAQSPNAIASDYSHAKVAARIMLTGHVHQAIPDVAEKGYAEHWEALNRYGEERWELVKTKADTVRAGFASRIDCEPRNLALAANIHELIARFISALPLRKKPKVVCSDGEHPMLARQLARLEEEGVEVCRVAASPAAELVERLAAQIDSRTAAVCLSSVCYETGMQTLELDTLLPFCQKHGAELLVDAYQSVNVLDFSILDYNLEQAFVIGGGSSYCQMGNGNAFMHVPPGRSFRPMITGPYRQLSDGVDPARSPIPYANDASCFNGSSYDALAHFRACWVFDYFKQRELDPGFLHDINQHQLNVLARDFRAFDFDPGVIELCTDVEYLGGFIAFKAPKARQLSEMMRDRGVHTDYRNNWLRMGPAPYLCDEQLSDGVHALDESVRELQRIGDRV